MRDLVCVCVDSMGIRIWGRMECLKVECQFATPIQTRNENEPQELSKILGNGGGGISNLLGEFFIDNLALYDRIKTVYVEIKFFIVRILWNQGGTDFYHE